MTDDTGLDTDRERRLTAACSRFDAAYAEWLAARADLAAAHDGADGSEQAERVRADRERVAELALIAAPAPHSTAVWQKWELLERVLGEEADSGPGHYPSAIVALASLKADNLALGLRPWPVA